MNELSVAVVWLAVIIGLVAIVRRRSRPRRRVGAVASGAVYDLLNEDRRKAIEIIVEERAESRDPENRDGNLPELEDPNAVRPKQQ